MCSVRCSYLPKTWSMSTLLITSIPKTRGTFLQSQGLCLRREPTRRGTCCTGKPFRTTPGSWSRSYRPGSGRRLGEDLPPMALHCVTHLVRPPLLARQVDNRTQDQAGKALGSMGPSRVWRRCHHQMARSATDSLLQSRMHPSKACFHRNPLLRILRCPANR
jgi:hypothetical protein